MPTSEFIENAIYRHDPSYEEYILVHKDIWFQYDNIWHNSVAYRKKIDNTNQLYCRSKKDFMKKFTKIGMAK